MLDRWKTVIFRLKNRWLIISNNLACNTTEPNSLVSFALFVGHHPPFPPSPPPPSPPSSSTSCNSFPSGNHGETVGSCCRSLADRRSQVAGKRCSLGYAWLSPFKLANQRVKSMHYRVCGIFWKRGLLVASDVWSSAFYCYFYYLLSLIHFDNIRARRQ